MSEVKYKQPTYGNWRKPITAGLGKYDFTQSIIFLSMAVLWILLVAFGGFKGVIIGGVLSAVLYLLFAVKDVHSLTQAEKMMEFMMWWSRKLGKDKVFRSGVLAGHEAFKLPSKLGRLKIHDARDAHSRDYALVEHPNNRFSVTISCTPSGTALIDRDAIDMQVASWGAWLAHLSSEMGIVGATVTVETVPDNGSRLERAINESVSESAPEVSREMLEAVKHSYPAGVARLRAWVSLTFNPSQMGLKNKDVKAVAHEVGARLPYLRQSLVETGAGEAFLLTSSDLAKLVRCAYDPVAETIFDEAAARGEDIELLWSQAGVVEAVVERDYYVHDSGKSRVWVMTVPPRGAVFDSVLSRLIAPHPDITRKRVTLIYNPIPLGVGAETVQADLNMARSRNTNTSGVNARASVEVRAAEQTANEEATGASLINFGMIISATVGANEDIEQASTVITSLASSARLSVRPAYGIQDEAFAYSLPLGLVPVMRK